MRQPYHSGHRGNVLFSALDKAKTFNAFFTSMFAKVVTSIIMNFAKSFSHTEAQIISNIFFDSDDVFKLICGSDTFKASDCDNIPEDSTGKVLPV